MAALAINPLLNSQPFEETQDLDRKVSPQELQDFYREQESRDLQRKSSRRSRWSRRSTGKSITTLSSIRSSKSKERKSDVASRKDDAVSEKSLRDTATPSPTPQVPSFTRKQGDWNSNAPSFYLTSYEIHDPVGPPVYRNSHLARKGPSVLPSKPPVSFHTHSTPNAAIPPLITPQSSPTTTPDSSQVNLPQRRRRISLNTPQDNVDMLDVTDPWGQTWHHDSRYDVGFDRNNDAGTQQPRPRTTSLKPAPAGAARPSPLSQSTSAIELPISVPKSTATRRLSKRRTSGLRGLFGGSTPAIHTQAKEFEGPAPKSGTGFEVMRRQSQSVPVTPTSSPQQVRMASEPAESPVKSPSTPVTNNLLSSTGFSPVKREKRNSMLGKLVKRFSVMKKPATSPADITPRVEVEEKAESPQQLEVSSPPMRPSSRNSMTRPEFGRAASSNPLLSTIIGSPNSSYNGKPDAPQVEPEPRRTPSPTKRVPPPRIEQDSTPVASTSTLHPAEVTEPHMAEAEDNATADDRSSLSLTYNPSSVGVLTIANPDPISTASTPVQRNNSLPSIASSRPPPLPSKDPEPTAERDIVVQVPTINGLFIRSPPEGLGSLPPVERPFLPPLGVSSPFNMPSSMFGERTPRASMIPGAEAATPLVRSNNPLPATPAPSSVSWPSVSDSQPSSVRLSTFDDSTDGERTPTRRRSPERHPDLRVMGVRDVKPSPLPKRERTPTRRRSPERAADDYRNSTRESESKLRTQRERTPPRRRSPEKPVDDRRRSVRDEAKPREPPSLQRSQVYPINNRSSDDLTRSSPEKRPSLRGSTEDKRRMSSEKVPQKRESVRYSHRKDSPEKEPYSRRGERDSSGGRRGSYNRETSEYRDSRTESGDRRRPSPEKAVDRRSSVVDKEKRGRSRVEETYRLVRSESKGEEISRGNMATVREKGREWVVEEDDTRRSWKRDSTSPVKESRRSRDAEREREGDRRSGNAGNSKKAVPAGPPNARASGHIDIASSVPWPSSRKSLDVAGAPLSRASTATIPPSLPPKSARPADVPPPAPPAQLPPPPPAPALTLASAPALPPRPSAKQPDSRKAQPIASSSTTSTTAPPLPPRKEAQRIEPVAPRLPPRPQAKPVERTAPVLPPRQSLTQKEKATSRDVNVNKAQPPPPPPTPAPPPAPKIVPPPPPPPLPVASQQPPPPPQQSSSRLAAVPMARPASDMTPESEHYFLKAREAWDADRLKRGKSSAFDAEADAYMWSQQESRPRQRPPPPPAIETWQQSWSQPVERRQSLQMSVARPGRTSPTYHQAYPALNDGSYGSNHTSYSIQAPFLSNENSNQVYAPYRPARTPIPPFALDFDQSRSSNPLPTPPRQIAYDTPAPPRQGQPHSNQHISTEYWKNYSVTVPT